MGIRGCLGGSRAKLIQPEAFAAQDVGLDFGDAHLSFGGETGGDFVENLGHMALRRFWTVPSPVGSDRLRRRGLRARGEEYGLNHENLRRIVGGKSRCVKVIGL